VGTLLKSSNFASLFIEGKHGASKYFVKTVTETNKFFLLLQHLKLIFLVE